MKKLLHLRRIAGIEPASSPWQREILPFDHIRIFSFFIHNMSTHIYHIYTWILFVQCQTTDSLQGEFNSFNNFKFFHSNSRTKSVTPPLIFFFICILFWGLILNFIVSHNPEEFGGVIYILDLKRIGLRDERIKDTHQKD